MSNHTRWEAQETVDACLNLHDVAVPHRAELDRRTQPNAIDSLVAVAEDLETAMPTKASSRSRRTSTVVSKNVALKRGATFAEALRKNLIRKNASAEIRRRFGVGVVRVTPRSRQSVESALKTILDGNAADPTVLPKFGVIAADLANVQLWYAAVASNTLAVISAKGGSKSATRTVVQKELAAYAVFDDVMGAAELAYHDDPATLETFHACIPGHSAMPATKKPASTAAKPQAARQPTTA